MENLHDNEKPLKHKILIFGREAAFDNVLESFLKDEFNCEARIENSDILYDKIINEYRPNLILVTTCRKGVLIERIKETPSISHIPIIYLSGAASPEDFKASSADYCLSKPVDVFLLIEKAGHYLEQSKRL